MIAAIHQPHYFPWMGYLDKMAKVDKFILMDEVQLTDKSNMFRNKFLSHNGTEKFLTVCFTKKGYLQKKFTDVTLNKAVNWQKDHVNFLKDAYKKSPYFDEVWTVISPIFDRQYLYLCDVAVDTVLLMRQVFHISTEIVFQHDLSYNQALKKSELVLDLCRCVHADTYLSGNGARKYMDMDLFARNNLRVGYQTFQYPKYLQLNSNVFIPNLSSLDILFSCGIEQANKIFWQNVSVGR